MFTKQHWSRAKAFGNGMAQVSLVSASAYFVSHFCWWGAFVTGFGISWLWVKNVKVAAGGNKAEAQAYVWGAAFGSVFGMFVARALAG